MSVFFVIECSCGNSLSVRKMALRNNPSGEMHCKGLTKEGKACGRNYANTDLIRILDTGTEIYRASLDQEQIHFGQQKRG